MEKRIRHYDVLINEDNMRLDEFLAYKMGRMTRSMANRCIKAGGVSLMPYRPPKPALRVHTGDVVAITQTMADDTPQYDELDLLFENDDFWCFDKPAGMAVHPTANIYHNTVTRYVESQLDAVPYIVHRLDKDTSGALIVAKNQAVGKEMAEAFLSHQIHKEYVAIVYNAQDRYYPGASQDIKIPLGPAGRLMPDITRGVGSQDAYTEVHCDDIHGKLAKLRCILHTGRQHQIRVHLALTGTPILGDKLYFFGEQFYQTFLNKETVPQYAPHRHLLHAHRLRFTWKNADFAFTAPTPALFDEVFKNNLTDSAFPTGYARLFIK